MILQQLRRLARRITIARFDADQDKAFVRLAYLLAFKREPDEEAYRRHETELLNGRSRADVLGELIGQAEHEAKIGGNGSAADGVATGLQPDDADHLVRLAMQGLSRLDADPFSRIDIEGSEGFRASSRVAPEDVDEFVSLAFRKLLRRDPDEQTYASYREGFERGTTFVDLLKDVIASEEFQIIDEQIERLLTSPQNPAPPMPEPFIVSDMEDALSLLEARLIEKGCRIQLGAARTDTIDRAFAVGRMRGLIVTLSLLERL